MQTDEQILRTAINTNHLLRAIHSRNQCRHGAIFLMPDDASDPIVIPARCKSWTCPSCGIILRASWAGRIANAKPERFLTLTTDTKRFRFPAEAIERIKHAWPRLVRIIRREHINIEYCVVWELTQAGWPHLHVALRGGFIPQKMLSYHWNALGIGTIVDIRPITGHKGIARYVSKYMTKTAAAAGGLPPHLRIVQASRGFFPPDPPEEQDLLEKPTSCHFTHANPEDIANVLMSRFGYVLDPASRTAALRFTLPSPPTDPTFRDQVIDAISQIS